MSGRKLLEYDREASGQCASGIAHRINLPEKHKFHIL